MIFITGDTHRRLDIKKLDGKQFPEQFRMNRDDYVIITGDFGGVWTGKSSDDEILDWHEKKPYTTLFVGGNHENYDALNSFSVTIWKKGRVHRIRDHVLHLMNGQIFELENHTFFVMGGATSSDKMFRTEHETWWPQEEPSDEELREASNNLFRCGMRVDYILTHTIPDSVKRQVFGSLPGFLKYESRVERFLDEVIDRVEYRKWYSGHFHIDRELTDYRLQILYNQVHLL